MKKILNLLKNNIIGIVLGFVIAGSITATAVTMFASSDVSYDNTNSGASATNVKEALDELYGMVPDYYNPYAVGTPIYYNPVSGSKCFDYVSDNSLNENKGATTDTECMKWYIIGEDTDTIDMILDHNTTYRKAWITSADYGASSNSTTYNDKGPLTLLNLLHTDTDSWTGVEIRTDTYTDPLKGYIIDYSGYRARLIEANEIAELTGADKALDWDSGKPYGQTIGTQIAWYYLDGKYGTATNWKTQVATSQGASKYAWLFDYTNGCLTSGCNIEDNSSGWGYWTSSASGYTTYNGWIVDYGGSIHGNDVYDTSPGLRPVITIPKS